MSSYQPLDLAHKYVEPPNCLDEKPPIIFMHGVTSSKEYWRDIPNVVAAATRRKVYVVDARNHGDSPWSDVFNFDVNADDLLNFMDKIKAPTAVLIGHSMGGVAVMKAALKAPHRVEKLVVEDMGTRKVSQERLNVVVMYLSLAQAAIEQVPPTINEEEAKKIISEAILKGISQTVASPPPAQPTTYDDTRIQIKKNSSGRYVYKSNIPVISTALQDAPNLISDFVGEYKGSSSFIYGSLSPLNVGSDEEEIKKHFSRAEFVAIEDATHLVHTDKPKEFTDAVLEFLLRD